MPIDESAPSPHGRLRAILFDLDGTLIDSSEDLLRSVDHSFETAGVALPEQARSRAILGAPLEEMPAELGISMSGRQMEIFLAAFRAHYPLHWLDSTKLFGGAVEMLRALKAMFKLAIVTTKRQIQAERIAAELGISGFFDHVQGSRPDLRHKPAPDMLLAALDALGVGPSEAAMVGDTHRDVLAGKAAGCFTIAVTWGCGRKEALDGAGPDALAHTPEDTLRMLAAWPARISSTPS